MELFLILAFTHLAFSLFLTIFAGWPSPTQFRRGLPGQFDGSIWITFCSGRQQISKTSCSISGPTLTTIGRMTLWKDERRTRPSFDDSQISARFVGNPTVAPCTRRRWPPDLSESHPGCGIRSTSAELPRNRRCFPIATRFPDRIDSLLPMRSERGTHHTLATR